MVNRAAADRHGPLIDILSADAMHEVEQRKHIACFLDLPIHSSAQAQRLHRSKPTQQYPFFRRLDTSDCHMYRRAGF